MEVVHSPTRYARTTRPFVYSLPSGMRLRGLQFSVVALLLFGCLFGQNTVVGVVSNSDATVKRVRSKTIAAQCGLSYSVINNRYETRALYKPGLNLGLVRRFSPWFALELGFNRYFRHDALSLADIQSWSADLNGQLSMKIGESDLYFRTIFGVGYVDWKGYYVGPNLNDNYHYYYGKLLNDRFLNANLGWGFSHMFMKQRLEGFSDFRLRIAKDPRVLFSITDTAFLFGIRYTLLDSDNQNEKQGKADRKGNKNKKSHVYKWLKNR
jgi:hypothetical protein